jgi:hypothetical protein
VGGGQRDVVRGSSASETRAPGAMAPGALVSGVDGGASARYAHFAHRATECPFRGHMNNRPLPRILGEQGSVFRRSKWVGVQLNGCFGLGARERLDRILGAVTHVFVLSQPS